MHLDDTSNDTPLPGQSIPIAPREVPLIDKVVGYSVAILLFGWMGLAYLRSFF